MNTTTDAVAIEVRVAQLAHAATLARIAYEALANAERLIADADAGDMITARDNTLAQTVRQAKDDATETYNTLWNFRL